MLRYLIVSSDCHSSPRAEDVRPYIDPQNTEAFDAWAGRALHVPSPEARKSGHGLRRKFFEKPIEEHFDENELVKEGGETGYYDYTRRLQELEKDGVVGEVVFPNFSVPFGWGVGGEIAPDLKVAGARAYNRWLGERVSEHKGRHVGVAPINIFDVTVAVKEIQAAYDAGLRSVDLPDGMNGFDYPLYNDPVYEPMWALLEELDMPISHHAGGSANIPGPAAQAINLMEGQRVRPRRMFYCMFLGGVFERHPKLKFAFTEAGIDFVPDLIAEIDWRFFGGPGPHPYNKHISDWHAGAKLTVSAREVWDRQCFGGASFMPQAETAMRERIGVSTIMWGSDYPHLEGTWPYTRRWLKESLHGVPEAELRLMLGENALRCYRSGLDRQLLEKAAARVGPLPADI